MLYSSAVVLFVFLIACGVYGKVELREDINQTVTFDGDELDGSLKDDESKLCFGSSPDKSYPPCPPAPVCSTSLIKAESVHSSPINRQRLKGIVLPLPGAIKFNKDGTLNIMAAKLPSTKTATLQHLELYALQSVGEAIGDDSTRLSSASFWRFCTMVLVVVIIGILVWFCILHYQKVG